MTDHTPAAQAAMQEAVQRALELYAECYDTMTRIAHREGREPVVSPVSVAVDIRKNMVNAVVKALSKLRAPVADEKPRQRPPMCRISGVNEGVLRRAAMRHRAADELQDPSVLAGLADGLESIAGNENAALAAAYIRREADRLAIAPVAKPKRAPLDDWRVQAIAECLEAEWDDMTPDQAETDARLIVGYLIEYEKESDRIEAKHAAEPVEPIVQAIRNLRASAPVAGHQPYPAMPEPDVIAYGEAEDSYSRSAMESAMRAAHDRGYSVGWDHGKENASAPVAGEAQATMFWDARLPDEIHETLADAMYTAQGNHGLLQGDTVEIQQAVRLPALHIRVTDGDDDGDNFKYAVIEGDAAPQASEAVPTDLLLEIEDYLLCVVQGSMSRNNSEALASELGDRLRAALSAQPGAQKADPWRPIETAPKDEVILLFGGLKKEGKVYAPHVNIGYWTEQFGWTCLVYSHQEFAHIEPSHWMPRPPSPAQAHPDHKDGGAVYG